MSTIIIDNYDSFTWNLYQYFCRAGANVTVFRNDKVTLERLIELNPRNLVISPGPGHPREDTGVCIDAIKHFAGKIPIFGVCMGLQCMYECYGGRVGSAGEIVHGKTDIVTHDGLGVYLNIGQSLQETRYHSLSGDPATLPPEFVITSWTDSGCIMGIRHKEFTVEGVQYHPESILSEHGMTMIRNFLALRGGTWAENPGYIDRAPLAVYKNPNAAAAATATTPLPPTPTPTNSESWGSNKGTKPNDILSAIQEQRLKDIAAAKAMPGRSADQLKKLVELGVAPPVTDFYQRLRQSIDTEQGKKLAVLAEIKRASPSKGDICPDAVAAEQALVYCDAGAAAISVLTEPTWFKGSLEDLRQARQVIDGRERRPAILRKDFISDPYQVIEARVAGADTILLIVAMLSKAQLVELMAVSREYGMEPLVEVNNADEMVLAVELGARVIGINNRNLHTFDVDMGTTVRLAGLVPKETILIALSGITSPSDIHTYRGTNVEAVLVGEGLMRASDKHGFIQQLCNANL
ncbi:anthranilate synthase / indole-3-glycerol phosphate synthase [Spiromyces aspiralis]|uniref:Anthranilate synthase / indole-3-glycerol phosphate synthase n=1 Tax=Spiromyces aspiralis TaxID=68401 RepID=A0ACC1HD31_9FUNG|nr:anthranilate synthase / indole-3-glycerol phosphate synthase [Spiromyces aspiralis]